MTDEEYVKNISSVSTEELFNSLEYYGYDSYYAVLWRATIEELKKRVGYRPQGKWIPQTDYYGFTYWKCSECGRKNDYEITNFCFSCGTDMRGEAEE